jgi:hypothetical protein
LGPPLFCVSGCCLSCFMCVLYTFTIVCYNPTRCASAFAERGDGGGGAFVYLFAKAVACYDPTGCTSAIAGGGGSVLMWCCGVDVWCKFHKFRVGFSVDGFLAV